jgi:geranylgeranyl diphosphate synthase type I
VDVTLLDMTLPEALQRSREILDQQTDEFFSKYIEQVAAVDPAAVMVAQHLHTYSKRSGKAIRPLLVAVGAALSQGTSLEEVFTQKKVKLAMLVIELTHKRILMADDVADQDEQRHGAPSFHVEWFNDLKSESLYSNFSKEFQKHIARSYTEVAGIVYQSLTYTLLADEAFSEQERRNMLLSLQKHTYDPTPAGWFRQFAENFHQIQEIDLAQLYRTFELITGEYSIVNPLQFGTLLGEKSNDFTSLFVEFGYPSGILFQITDDLIGVFGDPEVTGKPVGNDFREGKKSVLVQYAYRQANPEQQELLQKMIGNQEITAEQTAEVTQLIRDLGAEAFAQEEARQQSEKALAAIKKLPDGEVQSLLREFVQFILHRQK